MTLISHLYGHYARILNMDITNNYQKLREPFNHNNRLKSLYTRLNER